MNQDFSHTLTGIQSKQITAETQTYSNSPTVQQQSHKARYVLSWVLPEMWHFPPLDKKLRFVLYRQDTYWLWLYAFGQKKRAVQEQSIVNEPSTRPCNWSTTTKMFLFIQVNWQKQRSFIMIVFCWTMISGCIIQRVWLYTCSTSSADVHNVNEESSSRCLRLLILGLQVV